jgi:hypothetical protein
MPSTIKTLATEKKVTTAKTVATANMTVATERMSWLHPT